MGRLRSLKGFIRPLEGPYPAHLAVPPGLVALPSLVRVWAFERRLKTILKIVKVFRMLFKALF